MQSQPASLGPEALQGLLLPLRKHAALVLAKQINVVPLTSRWYGAFSQPPELFIAETFEIQTFLAKLGRQVNNQRRHSRLDRSWWIVHTQPKSSAAAAPEIPPTQLVVRSYPAYYGESANPGRSPNPTNEEAV